MSLLSKMKVTRNAWAHARLPAGLRAPRVHRESSEAVHLGANMNNKTYRIQNITFHISTRSMCGQRRDSLLKFCQGGNQGSENL